MTRRLDTGVEGALSNLRVSIEDHVRGEQRRCPLTSLQNQIALQEHVESLVGSTEEFFLAFVEVDRFKSINDRFGYEAADALLVNVARILETGTLFFGSSAKAFRQHGDEFFIVGPATTSDADKIESNLDLVRQNVERLALSPSTRSERMSCTVTIGWLRRSDLNSQTVTSRQIFGAVESAVANGKAHGRNRVTRFDPARAKQVVESVRQDCSKCSTRFSLDFHSAQYLAEKDLWCPNCGDSCPRPPTPSSEQSVKSEPLLLRLEGRLASSTTSSSEFVPKVAKVEDPSP
jgi:diguanylate cyclase (GGDEF)-like protein